MLAEGEAIINAVLRSEEAAGQKPGDGLNAIASAPGYGQVPYARHSVHYFHCVHLKGRMKQPTQVVRSIVAAFLSFPAFTHSRRTSSHLGASCVLLRCCLATARHVTAPWERQAFPREPSVPGGMCDSLEPWSGPDNQKSYRRHPPAVRRR